MLKVKNFRSVIGSFVNRISYAKKIDIVMALLFIGVIWFRLGTYISMCITHPDLDVEARWFIVLLCVSVMIAVFVVFGFGTLFESQGEQGTTTRREYLYIMKYCTGGIAGVIAAMTPIYIANIQDMSVLGYTAIPCIFAVLALYLVYRIKYNEVVG